MDSKSMNIVRGAMSSTMPTQMSVSCDYSYGVSQNIMSVFTMLNPEAVGPSELGAALGDSSRKISAAGEMEFYRWMESLPGFACVIRNSPHVIYRNTNGNNHRYCGYDDEQDDDSFINTVPAEYDMFSGFDGDIEASSAGTRVYIKRYDGCTSLVLINGSSIRMLYNVAVCDSTISEINRDFMEIASAYKRMCIVKQDRNRIYQISMSNGGYYLSQAKIDYDEKYPFEDLYPDEFFPVAENIDGFIKNGKSGMVILHGLQGSGKTSYIRKLINDNRESKFVYLPMAMAGQLSSPDFISFMQDSLSNSVIVIEDCEQLLEDRTSSGSSSAISTLLNMSDGLLADGLNIKFVCTFNAEINRIDKALLRKGRLVDKYEFGKLPEDKAKKLAGKLYGSSDMVTGDMSLADIFNINSDNHSDAPEKDRRRIGFY